MQSNNVGLISRSSSAALSMAQQSTIFDDMNIAASLLTEPKDPRHRSSFTGVSFVGLDGSDDQQQRSDAHADGHPEGRSRRAMRTSNTWTSSSGDVLSDQDDVDDRTLFVQEYNRLARKHGVRQVDPQEYDGFTDDLTNPSTKQGSWFSRKILRKTSSSQSVRLKPERHMKHRRSISDLSLRLKAKRDKLKDKDLQELVRLCGSSLLYLPTEYAAGSLAVPTCFRATAQHLVQHAPSTRGVFRVSGSQNVVAALYNHYGSMDEDGQVVSGTVRCPTLPDHIRCDVHDVASAFKRFLSGLPGGILGSLHLFSVFISIQTQLRGDPELTRTKQSKVRARLIALSIATLRSEYRRELICAVFGLLSMIGRAAEIAPREDERGRPLPTADLMGYGPLGIVFGPLLVGDLLEDYTMRIANPQGGLVLLPISPPKSRKEKHKKSRTGDEGTAFNTHVDKIKVANSITEMLITHWRDVVRHMKNLSALKVVVTTKSVAVRGPRQPMLRPSASESFALRKPPDWDQFKSPMRRLERSVSPTPTRRTHGQNDTEAGHSAANHGDMLIVKKQRSKNKPLSSHRLSGGRSLSILSPTAEEKLKEEQPESPIKVNRTIEDQDQDQAATIISVCPNPPCTSGSLRLTSSPLKDDMYSPSSSSDDGTFPPNMIPLPSLREELVDSMSLQKENKNPRPLEPTIIRAESPMDDGLLGHDSKQQLHFMSTPTFSNSNPPKSSRKKVRHSKESSSSTGKGKSVRSPGGHSKLQKQSPASIERGKSKHQRTSKQEEQPHKVEMSKPRDHDAELKEFVSEWTALDTKRKVLQAEKSKDELQNFTAVLDAEQANLEARYEEIKADKAAFERNLALLEAKREATKVANAEIEKVKPPAKSAKPFGQPISLQDHSRPQANSSTTSHKVIAKNKHFAKADIDTLEVALKSSDQERENLRTERIQLLSDQKELLAKQETQSAELATWEEDTKYETEWAKLHDRKESLEACEQAVNANSHAIVVRLSTLDESSQRHPNREQSVQRTGSVAQDIELKSASSQERPNFEGLIRDPIEGEADQWHPAIEIHESIFTEQQNHDACGISEDTQRSPETLRADLAAFRADVAIWKDKWKSYNQGKKTISSSEKKFYDEEKDLLNDRWHNLKVRMDTQKDAKQAKEQAQSSPMPFKHLVFAEPESHPSVPSSAKPEITLSRASPHAPEDPSRSPRRMGGSDPGLQPRGPSHSPRRVSRSLYEDPKRKRNLLDISKVSRDPLSRVSREEDDASLAVLAQALDVHTADDLLEKMPKPNGAENASSPEGVTHRAAPVLVMETSTTVKKLDEPPQCNDTDSKASTSIETTSQATIFKVPMQEEAAEKIMIQKSEVAVLELRPDLTASSVGTDPVSPESEKAKLPIEVPVSSQRMQVPVENATYQLRRSTVPMMSRHERVSGRDTTRTAGSPSKISALVAKFNQETPQSTVSISPAVCPTKSPAKTPSRPTAAGQVDFGTAKDSIVSPYTTNPASPTRSQKSDKTPQSSRTAIPGECRALLDPKSSPVRKPTPKRILRDSLYDSTPLRPVVRGAKSPRSTPSPIKPPNPYAISLRSVQKNTDCSPTRLSSATTKKAFQDSCELDGAAIGKRKVPAPQDIASTAALPPPRFNINTLLKSETHVQESSASSSNTVRPVRGSVKEFAATTDKVNSELDHVQLKSVDVSHKQEDAFDLPIFDGPGGPSNIGRVLPHPDPLPVAHHLNLTRPPTIVHSDSEDTGLASVSQVVNPPPGRSSSLLYNQVRNLQRQLSEKVEEIQHLRQQLSARGNLEIGTLSEELRETKQDLQAWKTRAEVAEKQLEILTKMPSRNNSLKHTTSTSSKRSDRLQRSSIDSRKEEGTMAERIRKALHGMDGAESPQRWASEESTDTVIRGLQDIVTGSEYSMWVEQTMNAIDSTDNGEGIR
ncbi:hypothetical protein ONS96_009393 [Cadophora gregata f. sp. sojae]|nr:hypothetical protein ONS96_009393 [Cadophora gregata f. sp. sojae]